jgi:hypothetical protein
MLSEAQNEVIVISGTNDEVNIPIEIDNIIFHDSCEVCNDVILYNSNQENNIQFSCNHKFCFPCIREFYTYSVNNNLIYNIKCLKKECNEEISKEYLKYILDEKTYEKYSKFLYRSEMNKDNHRIQCPFPDCDSFAWKNTKEAISNNISSTAVTEANFLMQENDSLRKSTFFLNKNESISKPFSGIEIKIIEQKRIFVICETGHKFCATCKELNWHTNMKCKFEENREFMNYVQNNLNDYKNCPSCGYWTEKLIGCNHITCANCKYQWCWLCQDLYKSDHYSNPLSKCKGRMYEGTNINQIMINVPPIHQLNLQIEPIVNEENENRLNRLVRDRIRNLHAGDNNNQFVIGNWYSSFRIKRYDHCFVRFIIGILLFISLIISNFCVMRISYMSIYKKFPFRNYNGDKMMRLLYNIIYVFTSLSFGIFLYTYGVLVTLLMYPVPIIRYICKG